MKKLDFSIIMIFTNTLVGITNLLIYCYFGKMATESYEKMADCLYECNWLDLSVQLQKHFIIMIGNAQRSIYYHGSGMSVLNLQTFNKVRQISVPFFYEFSNYCQ